MNIRHPLEGTWVSTMPNDSDDYLLEYRIEKEGDKFLIFVKDMHDGEAIEITDVKWDGKILSFKSFVPSTQRSAYAQFRIQENGNIESKFTFTVLEDLKRKQ